MSRRRRAVGLWRGGGSLGAPMSIVSPITLSGQPAPSATSIGDAAFEPPPAAAPPAKSSPPGRPVAPHTHNTQRFQPTLDRWGCSVRLR